MPLVRIKETTSLLKLDAGMTDVLRPSLYGSQHPLVVVPSDAAKDADDSTHEYVVVGHCCESGDLLTPAPDEPETLAPRLLKSCERGDLLVVESVGAYCSAMSTAGYNSFPTAPEVLKTTKGGFVSIRRPVDARPSSRTRCRSTSQL